MALRQYQEKQRLSEIKFIEEEKQYLHFEDLEIGDLFRPSYSNLVHLKTSYSKSINLGLRMMVSFSSSVEVVKLNGELRVWE